MVQPTPENTCHCPPTPTATAHGEAAVPPAAAGERLVIPEIQEYAEVSTRTVETGAVRITRHVHDLERTFNPTLHEQHVRVDRIPVNRIVKNPPEVRTEGDTTVIPVVEEVMVKLLILREEIHVKREAVQKPSEPQHVTLRREQVAVERIPGKVGDSCAPERRPD